jgi:galactokinase
MPQSKDSVAELTSALRGPLRASLQAQRTLHIRSAPGRLDVLGGLAAETGGTLAQIAIPARAAVAVQQRDDGKLIVHSLDVSPPIGEPTWSIATEKLFRGKAHAPAQEITKYIDARHAWAGPFLALWYLLQHNTAFRKNNLPDHDQPVYMNPRAGATVLIHSQIPMGAGQASGTAALSAAVLALRDMLGEPLPDVTDIARLIHRAEAMFPSGCIHAVDALSCLCAGAPPERTIMRLASQSTQLVGHIRLPKDVRIMGLDTGVRYNAAAATVEQLRTAGAMGMRIVETIYRDLGQRHTPLHGHLSNLSPVLYRQYFRSLLPRRMRGNDFVRTFDPLPPRTGAVEPSKMYRVRAAVDHLLSEHEHAESFLQAMEELADPAAKKLPPAQRQRTLSRAGRLMLASHHSYRLRLELSCREADALIEHLMESGPQKGVYGARITGSGGGGTVVVLMNRSEQAMDAVLSAIKSYNKLTGLRLGVSEAGGPGTAGALETPGATVGI